MYYYQFSVLCEMSHIRDIFQVVSLIDMAFNDSYIR